MVWAIEQTKTKDPASTLVLICLANYANKFGHSAFPSVQSLCEETRLSESSVRRRLQELQRLGLIYEGDQSVVASYIKRLDRRPVCYDLAISRGVTETPRQATGCQEATHGVSNEPSRGVSVTPNPIQKSVRKPLEVVRELGARKVLGEDFAKRFKVKP